MIIILTVLSILRLGRLFLVLDAAKSNRCVSLLRQEPGQEELIQVAEGVFYSASREHGSIQVVKYEKKLKFISMAQTRALSLLCFWIVKFLHAINWSVLVFFL